MSKKAQAMLGEETFKWIINIILAVLVFGVLLLVMVNGSNSITQTPEGFETDMLLRRFVYSPDCFVYYDYATQRAIPGSIDLDRFSQETLDLCYREPDPGLPAFRLTLEKESIETQNYKEGKFEQQKDIPVLVVKPSKDAYDPEMRRMTVDIQNYR